MHLKMGYKATTSSIKQGSLREMNKPGTKYFKVPELDETKCIQWDDEMPKRMHTCMPGETVAL
eukprot:13257046-Ditylum_brightwellii.AAC.1